MYITTPSFVNIFLLQLQRLGSMGGGPASSGAGVLPPDADPPPVPESPVGPDLLHPLDVLAELGVEGLGEDLGVLPGLEVLLPVEEPEGDLELLGGLDDGHDLLDLVGGQVSGALVHVHLGLLADEARESSAETLDLCEGKDHVTAALDVGIEDTENVLELLAHH